jgi:outer membrane protein assembly factor BamD
MKRTYRVILPLILLVSFCLLESCGSSNTVKALSAEDRFALGKTKFDKGDYVEAIADFEIVKLQFPGSSVAAEAQYYLAESHYDREEYLLAAEEYQALRRSMPASRFASLAQYKTGLCYYQLSPKAELDQKYTTRAITELQAFIEYNPTHELVHEAEAKIRELNDKLAQKIYLCATQYMTLDDYTSATIYYTAVVEKYHDSQYAEPAFLGKVKSLVARHKFNEAGQEIGKFLEKYPKSALRAEAESLKADIENELKKRSSTQEADKHEETPRHSE